MSESSRSSGGGGGARRGDPFASLAGTAPGAGGERAHPGEAYDAAQLFSSLASPQGEGRRRGGGEGSSSSKSSSSRIRDKRPTSKSRDKDKDKEKDKSSSRGEKSSSRSREKKSSSSTGRGAASPSTERRHRNRRQSSSASSATVEVEPGRTAQPDPTLATWSWGADGTGGSWDTDGRQQPREQPREQQQKAQRGKHQSGRGKRLERSDSGSTTGRPPSHDGEKCVNIISFRVSRFGFTFFFSGVDIRLGARFLRFMPPRGRFCPVLSGG